MTGPFPGRLPAFRFLMGPFRALPLLASAKAYAGSPGGFMTGAASTPVRPALKANRIQAFVPTSRGAFTFALPYNTQGWRITDSRGGDGSDTQTLYPKTEALRAVPDRQKRQLACHQGPPCRRAANLDGNSLNGFHVEIPYPAMSGWLPFATTPPARLHATGKKTESALFHAIFSNLPDSPRRRIPLI